RTRRPASCSCRIPSSVDAPADHPHLHSFPTRRSSDLDTDRDSDRGHQNSGAERRPAHERNTQPRQGCDGRQRRNDDQDDKETPEDRKSTRLNSSHVKISYAVFCLKKKTAPSAREWPCR